MLVFLVEFVFFFCVTIFSAVGIFLIQNSPSPFCSLGFSSLGGPRRLIMLCLAVGLARRPTGKSAAVSVRVGLSWSNASAARRSTCSDKSSYVE